MGVAIFLWVEWGSEKMKQKNKYHSRKKIQHQRKCSTAKNGPVPAENAVPAKKAGLWGKPFPQCVGNVTSRVTKVQGAGLASQKICQNIQILWEVTQSVFFFQISHSVRGEFRRLEFDHGLMALYSHLDADDGTHQIFKLRAQPFGVSRIILVYLWQSARHIFFAIRRQAGHEPKLRVPEHSGQVRHTGLSRRLEEFRLEIFA
jgi:hypothetical protein